MILKEGKILKQKEFKKEKDLQEFFSSHLKEILGYKKVDNEVSVGDYRIDTLAVEEIIDNDKVSRSFKIIEYKNVRNHSLVDQGYAYLKLLLDRKNDFVMKYNKVFNTNLTDEDIDWSLSRIVFVSSVDFTRMQKDANNFRNMAFDLYKVTRYEGDIVDIEKIEKTSKFKVDDIVVEDNEVDKEIKTYTEEDHVKPQCQEIYDELKERILNLGDIDIVPQKTYIAFKGLTNIVSIVGHNNKLEMIINLKNGKLSSQNEKVENVANKGHLGPGAYRMYLSKPEDIDEAMPIIRESYKENKK